MSTIANMPFTIGNDVVVTWPSGDTNKALVVWAERRSPKTVVLAFDYELEEQYEYEQGINGKWYEINNSDVPCDIEKQ